VELEEKREKVMALITENPDRLDPAFRYALSAKYSDAEKKELLKFLLQDDEVLNVTYNYVSKS